MSHWPWCSPSQRPTVCTCQDSAQVWHPPALKIFPGFPLLQIKRLSPFHYTLTSNTYFYPNIWSFLLHSLVYLSFSSSVKILAEGVWELFIIISSPLHLAQFMAYSKCLINGYKTDWGESGLSVYSWPRTFTPHAKTGMFSGRNRLAIVEYSLAP